MENKFNLNNTYSWFENTIGKSVTDSVCLFFENRFGVYLASIGENQTPKETALLKNEFFYTTRVSIKNKQNAILRVTSDFIRIVFHDTFGSNGPLFNLENLTELEQKILNSFAEFIIKDINTFLINENETAKIDPTNKTELNFVFLIKNKDTTCGKISLTLPLNRLEPVEIKKENSFNYADFENNYTYVNLFAGCAKISLDDLKNLSKDDIIVLEERNIQAMTLKTEFLTREFKVKPDSSLMLDIDEEDEIEEEIEKQEYKENIMPENKNLWDDIQIELGAEFQKVKMPLGELKQISKGQVVELGPVVHNEISLLVENKTIAKGDLVIINDKYGVKVTEVFANKNDEQNAMPSSSADVPRTIGVNGVPPKKPQEAAPQKARPAQTKQAPQKNPEDNKEEFDYSNFEE